MRICNRKNLKKKFNLVFFVDEKKTYHFKINYLLFKIIATIFLFFIIFSITIYILSWKLLKENNYLSNYVMNLKSFYIHNYFESNFNSNTQDEINENSEKNVKGNVIIEAKPDKLLTVNTQESTDEEEFLSNENDVSFASDKLFGIEIVKEKLVSHNKTVNLSFLLLNTIKSNVISGTLCAQIEMANIIGDKKLLNYPESTSLDDAGMPMRNSCLNGEHVKFSRLRPVNLNFKMSSGSLESIKPKLIIQKATIYFIQNNEGKVIKLKELSFNEN